MPDERGGGARPRIVLEVAAENERAIRFYRRNDFQEIGHAATEHPRTGRTLSYIHMARSV